MKKFVSYELVKEQLKFLYVSFAFVITSLIGMIIYYRTGLYFINPCIYLVTLLIGIGWAATAITSIKNKKANL